MIIRNLSFMFCKGNLKLLRTEKGTTITFSKHEPQDWWNKGIYHIQVTLLDGVPSFKFSRKVFLALTPFLNLICNEYCDYWHSWVFRWFSAKVTWKKKGNFFPTKSTGDFFWCLHILAKQFQFSGTLFYKGMFLLCNKALVRTCPSQKQIYMILFKVF